MDIIRKIIFEFPFWDLINVLSSELRFLCKKKWNIEYLWKEKLERDFGVRPLENPVGEYIRLAVKKLYLVDINLDIKFFPLLNGQEIQNTTDLVFIDFTSNKKFGDDKRRFTTKPMLVKCLYGLIQFNYLIHFGLGLGKSRMEELFLSNENFRCRINVDGTNVMLIETGRKFVLYFGRGVRNKQEIRKKILDDIDIMYQILLFGDIERPINKSFGTYHDFSVDVSLARGVDHSILEATQIDADGNILFTIKSRDYSGVFNFVSVIPIHTLRINL